MTFTAFLTWIAVAVVTGWAASIVLKNGGHGIVADVLLALAGSGLVSVVVVGVVAGFDGVSGFDLAASGAVALVGAVAAIATQRTFFGASVG